jgi:long-chain acyl-CoA synthetase
MALDVELYRRTLYIPDAKGRQLRRVSVIDVHPEQAAHTLVFVHGYGGDAMQWLYQLRYFAQHVRVIAPDLRGHGLSDDSDALPYTMSGLVDDLEQVLDALDVQRPFTLIAHSFGGAVAGEYVLRHPEHVERLILIGVPTRFIIRPILRRLMNIPDPIFSFVARKIRVALYASQRTLKGMHDRVMAVWRGDERLQQLRVPTLVIRGHRDIVFMRESYESVARIIPGAHEVVIPVSAHLVQLERPDAVNRAIRRFLEPKQQAGAREKQFAARSAARLAERPWLAFYDRDVPEIVPPSQQLLPDLLSNAARHFPARPALIFFHQKISFRELDLLSNRFARALRELNVQKGDRVAVILPNIPQCVIAFFGALKAGAVVVLGSPLSNEEEIAFQLRDSGASVLLTLASYRAVVERICPDTVIQRVIYTDVREYLPVRQRVMIASLIEGSASHDSIAAKGPKNHAGTHTAVTHGASRKQTAWREHSFQRLLRGQRPLPLDCGAASSDLALLQYTSGTSDMPKGVMLSHCNLVMNLIQVRHWVTDARRGREVMLGVLPLSHSYGITSCMNLCLALAGTLVLLPTHRIDQILAAIKQYRPSLFPGVPALYLAIANYPRVRSYGVAAIRTCISGSAPLPVEVQEAFEKLTRGRLVEGYGLTEASPVTHANPLKGERHVGSIGIPVSSTEARIVDTRTGETLPPGEVGELLVRGPQVMQGYWNMSRETEQALADGWLHTGDLASMDEDGFFTIVDRKKDLILSGPYNVYPRDVEEVLYEHPKVLEAAVVNASAQENGNASPFIKAVVVLKRGERATTDELLALCRERLDAYKVPARVEFRAELPKNAVGKVLRRLLVEG